MGSEANSEKSRCGGGDCAAHAAERAYNGLRMGLRGVAEHVELCSGRALRLLTALSSLDAQMSGYVELRDLCVQDLRETVARIAEAVRDLSRGCPPEEGFRVANG